MTLSKLILELIHANFHHIRWRVLYNTRFAVSNLH